MTRTMRQVQTGKFGGFRYNPRKDRYAWDAGAVDLLGNVDRSTKYSEVLARLPPSIRKPYEEWRIHAVESGRPDAARIPFETIDGEIMLEVHVHRIGDDVHGFLVDVSEDEDEQQAVQTQLTVMNFAERIAGFGSWAYDIQNEVFTASDGAANLLLPGAERVEFTFEKVLDLMASEDRDKIRKAYERALATGQVQREEFRFKDEPRWFAIRFLRILDHDGNATHTCGLVHETTDLRAHEHWRQEFERLHELHEVRSRFINAATHELNQPLTPMRLELAMLATRLPQEDAAAKSVQVLQRNVDRLEYMLRDLLDAARSQAGRLEVDVQSMDIRGRIDHIIETMRPVGKQRHVDLVWNPCDVAPIAGDPMRVDQCLSNILHNAVKFTQEGTHVEVETKHRSEQVAVSVHDLGPGLDAAQRKQLFTPFEMIHASPAGFRGTGLGLFVTKSLMEAMQGSVEVESSPGNGSTFTLAFRKAQDL